MLHARLLTYLDEVVRQGSIRKAADRLNVAASAISRQILALEQDMGVRLFDRSGRRLVPSAAGELLIRHVRETMRGMAHTQSLIEDLKGLRRGVISVALMSGLAANILPRAAISFRERNPRVELKLQLMTTGEQILDAVERSDVDLGIGFDFSKRANVRLLHAAQGRLGAVMSSQHPLAHESELSLRDCSPYPLILADETTAIRPYIVEAFTDIALDCRGIVETNAIEMMRHVVMCGNGICFLTPFDVETDCRDGRLTYIPIRELQQHTQTLMLVENAKKTNTLSAIFAEQLKAAIIEASYGVARAVAPGAGDTGR
ncbi:transcriptional regulator [Gluconacetobacter liquefaciens]|uniref:DNA-binding transcriptional LysR family regulator n=1 Tax=Gluconacetobacter liquefaciens TaxID=89584 RepID=A0A370FZ86_GLULI|nr:LysR family transcriptional regulator [Gluconacetobacter liquefaciens]MBB2187295.1 LysR family transcriptional regulator [Gluconacetobacter liquefaciens]RDI36842.1 DNA-binding transcriptional LysR family regulator [Gluconacetobacter liquefaciens]GBQ94101.1 LysR family transcriptional regulator [Gluconacetobacter liquefaciens NRIC 0522]GEB39347.1 transcriptional regulator [Gluconacetobacter liquefaciens]